MEMFATYLVLVLAMNALLAVTYALVRFVGAWRIAGFPPTYGNMRAAAAQCGYEMSMPAYVERVFL
jgi:hypothetical protein